MERHGTAQTLTTNLKKIADKYNKKVMVAEISYAWTYKDGDGYPDKVFEGAGDMEFNYPVDAEGQAAAVRDAIAAIAAVGEKGIGTFYWEPAWVPPAVYDESAANAQPKGISKLTRVSSPGMLAKDRQLSFPKYSSSRALTFLSPTE